LAKHHIEVRVKPRAGLLDPQGAAVTHALESLGFTGISEVRVGKVIDLDIEATSSADAVLAAEEMCRKLLANPVTEDFTVGRAPAAPPAGAKA
jgi:phosphoribosylformylglycinamidine synthase